MSTCETKDRESAGDPFQPMTYIYTPPANVTRQCVLPPSYAPENPSKIMKTARSINNYPSSALDFILPHPCRYENYRSIDTCALNEVKLFIMHESGPTLCSDALNP